MWLIDQKAETMEAPDQGEHIIGSRSVALVCTSALCVVLTGCDLGHILAKQKEHTQMNNQYEQCLAENRNDPSICDRLKAALKDYASP